MSARLSRVTYRAIFRFFALKSPLIFLDKMRAVLVKDGKVPVENLYIGEAPKPTLGKGEVLVKESPSLIHLEDL